jgi:hypothetical protein
MAETQPERPAEGWKYPYVAGAVDFGSVVGVSVTKASDRTVGYAMSPYIRINRNSPPALGFLDEFCEEHGLNPVLRETQDSYQLDLSRREDIWSFIELLRPYLIAQHEVTTVLVEELFPKLESGKASSEEGFVELMGVVDEIRELTNTKTSAKYDQDHFRDLWRV